jgi:hypothetical protein
MFVGHIGVALIAKRARPSTSLGWYVAAATTLDLLWPVFLLVGIERVRIEPGATAFGPLVFESYPWSHSLLMAVVWGVLLAAFSRWRNVGSANAILIAVLVVSHWVLDFVTHGPDLPLWPGTSPHVGLGLWNSIPGTIVVEGVLWIVGIALYLQPRRAKSWVGHVAFWSLAATATAIWLSGPWSPPPPDVRSLAIFALMGWVAFPWAAWADRNYLLVESGSAE